MSDVLKPTSDDAYVVLNTKTVKTSSGAVFKIKIMGASSTVAYLSLLPQEGVQKDDVYKFLIANAEKLVNTVIIPNILEPKVTEPTLRLRDAAELLGAMAELSGLSESEMENQESFRKEQDGVSA